MGVIATGDVDDEKGRGFFLEKERKSLLSDARAYINLIRGGMKGVY